MIDIHKRISTAQALKKKVGSEVVLAGWAADVKCLGQVAFIRLRDRDGYVQLVASAGFKQFNEIEKIPLESVILAKGKVQKSKLKGGGNEVKLQELQVLSKAEPKLPIDMSGKIKTDLSKRLDWRFLDLRSPRHLAIFKIQSEFEAGLRDWFLKNGFIEIHTSKLVSQATESGASVFPVVYFSKKAFLAQSPQFYKQMALAAGFDRVFEIGPAFRAELHHTPRHLCEYTSIDLELAFIKDYEDIMQVHEQLLVHALKHVALVCKRELAQLGCKVKIPKIPFPRITMAQAYKLLQKAGKKIPIGTELDPEGEKLLSEIVKKKYGHEFVFLTEFPWATAPFYHMRKAGDSKWTCRADLIWNGLEITTLSQREHRYDVLIKQCKEKGLRPKDFEFYLNFFRYGCPVHGGGGTGIERLTTQLLGLENIRESTFTPRDPERLLP